VNFSAFLEWKAQIKRDRPHVVDLSETRIAVAFGHLRSHPIASSASARVHRCDLARTWCRVRGFPDTFAGRALVSEGVRDALTTLFRVHAAAGQTVAIPSDVYPVYWQIAAASGVTAVPFETFPHFDIDSILSGVAASGASVALLASPLKLHGRRWTSSEAAFACRWLAEQADRRLILDGVYSFGCDLDAPTRALIDTGQVVYLDSLSKGWLHEKVFGAVVVPADDFMLYRDAFRSRGPRQEQLVLAATLLDAHANFPRELSDALAVARASLTEKLVRAGLEHSHLENGYLAIVERTADEVLDHFGLMMIPASVFGVRERGYCLASSLAARPSSNH
jgi:aspartate/methionine/tyrosine aminotransferase